MVRPYPQDEKKLYVQMELCEGGTLRHTMTHHGAALRAAATEARVWEVVQHIARGLVHIHSYNVIHCDLKPDNIMVSRDGASVAPLCRQPPDPAPTF